MSSSFLLSSTSLIHHLSSSLRFWPYFYPTSFLVKPSHTGAYFTPKWLFYYLHIGLWFIHALAPLISFWFRSQGGRHILSSLTFHLSNIIYHLCPKCSVLSLSGWLWRTCYLPFAFWLIYPFSWCVPQSTTHLGCLVIPNWPHTSISFFDYMCSQIDHTYSQRGANVITQKWSSRLLAPF